jgi:hypothetical protein
MTPVGRTPPCIWDAYGTLGPDGQPLVDGHRWDSPAALELVQRAAGEDAWLAANDGLERFDILPLLVATDGAVAAFRRDIRRRFGGRLALNAMVLKPGTIRVGDSVRWEPPA